MWQAMQRAAPGNTGGESSKLQRSTKRQAPNFAQGFGYATPRNPVAGMREWLAAVDHGDAGEDEDGAGDEAGIEGFFENEDSEGDAEKRC